jgi:hypothetical protein
MEGRIFSTTSVFRFLEQDLFQGLILKAFVCFTQNVNSGVNFRFE